MTALPPADLARLVKLLGLLASDYQGERDSAALAVVRLVRRLKLSWSDVIVADSPLPAGTPTPGRDLAKACSDRQDSLSARELAFITNVLRQRRLSTKQRAWLLDVAERLGLTEAAT